MPIVVVTALLLGACASAPRVDFATLAGAERGAGDSDAVASLRNYGHWAVALPVSRAHPVVGSVFVNHNVYLREALLEAVLRFVDADLMDRRRGQL